MKRKLVLILTLFAFNCLFKTNAQSLNHELSPSSKEKSLEAVLKDGWYPAFVFNDKPDMIQLMVQISDNKVVAMRFETGSLLDDGRSTELYNYIGGNLNIKRNENGDIIKASTRVSIVEKVTDNYLKAFDIYLKL
ncbi:hypothetical protein [Solitalea lacus]|uniref:hypothetical protein n=1 Tax=Solitalea lacus TaxID=2911172 RepID=UPI001EDB118D|nr:hypothetical protein [Solitalea lacus]UKJ06753.1 hypothetical protein L2B55_14590 [Solitalea lacus]